MSSPASGSCSDPSPTPRCTSRSRTEEGPLMKKRWGWWNNCLVGITWDRWRALLAENTVDPAYRHRAAFLTLSSLRNSAWQRREARLYGEAVAKTVVEAPLFVLGHWRTGTTHLHNLLACD